MNIPISEIKGINVLFVYYHNKLDEVERIMNAKKVRPIPILKEGKLNGIVSSTDLQRLGFTKSISDTDDKSAAYDSLSLEDVMMNKPVTISSKATLKEVVEILIKNEFHVFPAVDNEVFMGIVTTTDLLSFILEGENHHVH